MTMCVISLFFLLLGWHSAGACQQGCGCENNELGLIINCRNQWPELTEVPTFAPSSTVYYELTLANNAITSISSRAFEGLKISKLDLTGNRIDTIANDAFSGIDTTLTELILEVESSTAFPVSALSALTRLTSLSVKGFNTPTLPSGALTYLSELQDLTMDTCGLESLSRNDVNSFTSTLRSLNLPNNQISMIPVDALSRLTELETLSLTQNQLSTLPDNGMSALSSLTELDLSVNSLDTINDNAFSGLNQLESLSLQVNSLNYHQLAPLSALTTLRELNLGHQQQGVLNQLPNGLFTNMASLEHLNLPGNGLESLSTTIFSGLRSLRKLLLAENGINFIESGTFSDLDSLEELNLDQQELSAVLSAGTFTGLEDTLTSLSLNRVSFQTANWAAVTPLRSLVTLSLQQNGMPEVPAYALQQMTQLQTLDLISNNIQQLTQDMLHGPENSLQKLQLNNNQMSSLTYCSLHAHTQLTHISLNSNPLTCDCQLQWLRRWVTNNYDQWEILALQWECTNPPSFFSEMQEADFVCDPPADPTQDVCNAYTTSTTSTTTPTTTFAPSTTQPSLPGDNGLAVEFTNVDQSSARVVWSIDDEPAGFKLEYRAAGTINYLDSIHLERGYRTYTLSGLEAETRYVVCVTAIVSSGNSATDHTVCEEVTTSIIPGGSSGNADSGATNIIIAVVVIIVILLIVGLIVGLVIMRRNGKTPFKKSTNTANGMPPQVLPSMAGGLPPPHPHMGNNSTRFARPPNVAKSTKEMEDKLEGFSQAERDRILSMLGNGGPSVSVDSPGGGVRYVPEPTESFRRRQGERHNPPPPPLWQGQDNDGYLPPSVIGSDAPYEDGYLPPSVIGDTYEGYLAPSVLGSEHPYQGYTNPAMQYSPGHSQYSPRQSQYAPGQGPYDLPDDYENNYNPAHGVYDTADPTYSPGQTNIYAEIPEGATAAPQAYHPYKNIHTLDPHPSTSSAPELPPARSIYM